MSTEKPLFVQSEQCKSLANCLACRTKQSFRDNIKTNFEVSESFDWFCPVLLDKDRLGLKVAVPPMSDHSAIVRAKAAKLSVLPSAPSTVTIVVSGFNSDVPLNGIWTLQAPCENGAVFGPIMVKLLSKDHGWRLDVYRRCCGGRLTLLAYGETKTLGSTFEMVGQYDLMGRKGVGSIT